MEISKVVLGWTGRTSTVTAAFTCWVSHVTGSDPTASRGAG